ncbi:site-specific DNA-methyltransferase [Candidatus Daviesbacteria bacterium]|nr:site-specific DNA-methyltransferase [Candidatus Daviesbacteria bacterium]
MAQLQFKGKQFVQNHHLSVPYHELIPKKDKSLTDKVSLHDNLIIHGDNLKALKALLPTYAGKIKCIYIDPPYNTGNEGWVYSDNVNSPMIQEWLKANKPVDNEDLTRHDKWLCMMTPRLKLLRELLKDDGVIFVSIDDNEVHHLRMLMDEIFGAENFIAILPTIMNLKGNQDQYGFAGTHEYIVVFANYRDKSKVGEFSLNNLEEEGWEEDEVSYFKKGANLKSSGVNAPREKRPNLYFPIYITKDNNIILNRSSKDDLEIFPVTDGKEMCWRWSKEKMKSETYDLMVAREGDVVSIYKKQRPELGELPSRKPKSLFYKPQYSSGNGTNQIKTIFGEKVFDNPKPLELIKDILSISTDSDSIVLDSFAGSGTTAHATLVLNKEDGGNRKFILVELEDTVADKITAERVKKVIKGVPRARNENLKNGLGGTFSYFELGKPIELESILSGSNLPTYKELARYVFYTATGEEFDESKVDEEKNFIGESKDYEVYLFYKPDLDYLKNTALTLDRARSLGKHNGKKRLIFAPAKYLDQDHLDELRIDFAQLPFEIYKLAK